MRIFPDSLSDHSDLRRDGHSGRNPSSCTVVVCTNLIVMFYGPMKSRASDSDTIFDETRALSAVEHFNEGGAVYTRLSHSPKSKAMKLKVCESTNDAIMKILKNIDPMKNVPPVSRIASKKRCNN